MPALHEPRVTVVIPNYNHGRFLERRLQSVTDQTFQDTEIIILDDASSDDSIDVISRFTDDPRVRVDANNKNSGSAFKQWNKGLRQARGDYVWIAESDDYAEPTFLEQMVAVMDENPSLGLAQCQSYCVDEDSNVLHLTEDLLDDIDARRWKQSFVNTGRREVADYMVKGCTIRNASAVLLRRSVCEAVGFANETFVCAGDYDLYVRMLLCSDFAFLARPLSYWRKHANTVRAKTCRDLTIVEESYRVLKTILESVPVSNENLEHALDIRALWLVRLGRLPYVGIKRQLELFRQARAVDPGFLRRLLRYYCSWYCSRTRVRVGAARRRIFKLADR